VPDFLNSVLNYVDDEDLVTIALELSQSEKDGLEIRPDEILAILKAGTEYTANFIPSSLLSEPLYLVRNVDFARRLAKDENIPVENVYREDVLYDRLIGMVYSPQEVVKTALGILDNTTIDKLLDLGLNLSLQAEMIADGEIDEEIKKLKLEKTKREMKEDESFLSGFEAQLAGVKKEVGRYTMETINRIWGSEAFHSLPEDLQERLKSGI